MILVLDDGCPIRTRAEIARRIEAAGCRLRISEVDGRTRFGIVGAGAAAIAADLASHPGVAEAHGDVSSYPFVAREHHLDPVRVRVGDVVFSADAAPVVVAGPCSVESRDGILEAARRVAEAGARMLRGGAYKPRTSPHSFQGLGERGLALLAEARERTGLPVVTEVVASEDVETVARHADMLQIGSRNMHNFRLLEAVGRQDRPVMLKRGLMATIDEWLGAAEYIAAAGNPRIVLCERGIRTFETATRNTLDVSAVPVLRERTSLPVVVDPSHAAGRRELVPALARAAIAVGADGLLVEAHPDPDRAWSDGRQSLDPAVLAAVVRDVERISEALGRAAPPPAADAWRDSGVARRPEAR